MSALQISIVHVVFDLDGCPSVSSTTIECGPPSLDRSHFLFSVCTLLQSNVMADARVDSRTAEDNSVDVVNGNIVGQVLVQIVGLVGRVKK